MAWLFADTIGVTINVILIYAIVSLYWEYNSIRNFCLTGEQKQISKHYLYLFFGILVFGFIYHRSIYRYKYFSY
jgi:hypothetical protein